MTFVNNTFMTMFYNEDPNSLHVDLKATSRICNCVCMLIPYGTSELNYEHFKVQQKSALIAFEKMNAVNLKWERLRL